MVTRSLRACSLSMSSQSSPDPAQTSASRGDADATHMPICGRPSASARFQAGPRRWSALIDGSLEVARDHTQRAVVGMEGVTTVREDGPRERAREDDLAL